MVRSHSSRGVLLTSNLPQLQNLIKRDPIAYKEEFLQQWTHYESIRKIFDINPEEQSQHFREIVTFIAQVAQCYPHETAQFSHQLSSLLLESYGVLNPDTRKSLVSTLVMLRNKELIGSIELLKSLFPLLPRTTSPSLRSLIRKTILSDIRTANTRTKNHKLNRAVQAMLFGMVQRGMDLEVFGNKGKTRITKDQAGDDIRHANDEALWAVILTKELWKKGIWNDAKSVSIISQGCFHPIIKVENISIHFFLGVEDEENSSDEDNDGGPDVKGLRHRNEINKKTRSGEKKLLRDVKAAKKRTKKCQTEFSAPNFSALQLLHDPQTFAEKLYDNLNRYDKRFSLDHKILMMQLLSRTMGTHKLCVLGFYSFIVKYITHHQLRIPSILASLAQSVHELTPPDVITPVIRKIAQEFVHPGVGSEIIAAGLNAIREVCKRQPWCMEEDLLGDLIEYRKSRDKSVVMAARSLLQLYRVLNPNMLKRRERGKEASMSMKGPQLLPFGHNAKAAVDIEGLNLLEEHMKELRSHEYSLGEVSENGNDEADWNGWEVDSESSESSGPDEGWIDVESGDDAQEVILTDSEGDENVEDKPDVEGKLLNGADSTPVVISTLATSKILTPADFALLNDLRVKAAEQVSETRGGSGIKRKLETRKSILEHLSNANESFISEGDILGPRKKAKADYDERIASIQKGREGREKFGSMKGKKNKDAPSSSTNREKARNKPIMMILSSGAVRGKKRASLRDKQKKLRAHLERSKKAYH